MLKLEQVSLALIVIICCSCTGEAKSSTSVTAQTAYQEDSIVITEPSSNKEEIRVPVPVDGNNKTSTIIDLPNKKSDPKVIAPTGTPKSQTSLNAEKPLMTSKLDDTINTPAPTTNETKDPTIEEKLVITTKPTQVNGTKQPESITPLSEPKTTQAANAYIQPLDELLKKYVSSSGFVDYTGLKNNSSKLEAIIKLLQSNVPNNNWDKPRQLAYWINAYNVFTLKLIIDNYPVKSIMDLHNGKPWDVKWISLGGITYSLNQIEHEIIRPSFNDARIHFAVNCAAKSCPTLSNEAYNPESLESQLDKNTKSFINNPAFNSIARGKVSVSKIFEWYKEDFGNLISYLNKYSKVQIGTGAQISFNEYDWSLNGK